MLKVGLVTLYTASDVEPCSASGVSVSTTFSAVWGAPSMSGAPSGQMAICCRPWGGVQTRGFAKRPGGRLLRVC